MSKHNLKEGIWWCESNCAISRFENDRDGELGESFRMMWVWNDTANIFRQVWPCWAACVQDNAGDDHCWNAHPIAL